MGGKQAAVQSAHVEVGYTQATFDMAQFYVAVHKTSMRVISHQRNAEPNLKKHLIKPMWPRVFSSGIEIQLVW